MAAPELTPAERKRVLWTIWGSFMAAIITYGLVVVMRTQGNIESPVSIGLLRELFTVVAVLLAGASIWWRRRSSGETQFMPAAPSAEKLQTACIITWALSEAVAILGLVLAVLTDDLGEYVPFGVAALVLFVIHRPNVWPQYASVVDARNG